MASWEACCYVDVLGCGMGHLYLLHTQPPRLPLVPDPQTGHRIHEVRSQLSLLALTQWTGALSPSPACPQARLLACGPLGVGGKDGIQHPGLGRVKEVCEGPATLLHSTPVLAPGLVMWAGCWGAPHGQPPASQPPSPSPVRPTNSVYCWPLMD